MRAEQTWILRLFRWWYKVAVMSLNCISGRKSKSSNTMHLFRFISDVSLQDPLWSKLNNSKKEEARKKLRCAVRRRAAVRCGLWRISRKLLCHELDFSRIWRCQLQLYPNLLLIYWVLLPILSPQSMRHQHIRSRLFEFSSTSLCLDGRLRILYSVLPSCYCLFASTGAALRRSCVKYSCSSIETIFKITSITVSLVISGIVVASRYFSFYFYKSKVFDEYSQKTMHPVVLALLIFESFS